MTALTLLGETARNMPLCHVRDFVRYNTRHLGLRTGAYDEPRVHPNKATRHGESVNFRTPDAEYVDLRYTARGMRTQFTAHIFEVLTHVRITDVIGIASPLNHNGFAQLAFQSR